VAVSASAPGAGWQQPEVVAGFLERRRRVLPMLDVQEDLLVRLLRRQGHPLERFLDLGGGDGAMSELLLSEWPRASAVLIDNSAAMLERAHARLGRFQGRWSVVREDLSRPGWPAALPRGAYDAVVSAYALHHLEAKDKREVFAGVLDLLEPGGMFLNMDYVRVTGPLQGLFEEQMAINLHRAERDRGSTRDEAELAAELGVSFDSDEEDRPDRAEDQVEWLAAAGFADAQIHFKWGEVAVYGAARPPR
jgi:tRNA (cmo5U34)-methyltransferase